MEKLQVGQELLNVPMGEMVKSLALGIAQAQWQLDKASMTVAELMSGQRLLRDLETGALVGSDNKSLPKGAAPVVVDTRVYFGYTYDPDPKDANKVVRTPQKVSMVELGFTPTFYQFVDTLIEVKISITMQGSEETTRSEGNSSTENSNSNTQDTSTNWWWTGKAQASRSSNATARVSTVDAKYSSKYSYSVEGASLLRTKLVPVPPPAILEERIREVMEQERLHGQKYSSQTS